MPHLEVNGTRLWYEDSAPDDRSKPAVVFSHGLLFDARQFESQVPALQDRFRVIRYDHRGQGQSDAPRGRTVEIETCTDDAVALIEKLDVGPCHFVGLSMGGFVAMRIAARKPELLRTCILLDTSAEPEPNARSYRTLNLVARYLGLWLVTGKVMPIVFGRTFMTDPALADARKKWHGRLGENKRSIYKAVTGVIEREGVADELAAITVPTLVMVGEEDTATVPAKAEAIHAAIAGSELRTIPRAGHSSAIENPEFVTDAILDFVARHPGTE